MYTSSTSIETAVKADKKAKIVTADKQKLKFKRLEIKNYRLKGITKPGSSTAKRLAKLPSEVNGKYLEIHLSDLNIEKIKLRNNTGSAVLTILAIFGVLLVAAYTFLVAGLAAAFN